MKAKDGSRASVNTHKKSDPSSNQPGSMIEMNTQSNSDPGSDQDGSRCSLKTQVGNDPSCTPGEESSEPLNTQDPHDSSLLLWADALGDLEAMRVATENRLRSVDQVKQGADHDLARFDSIIQGMKNSEHLAVLGLNRAVRRHPLGAWVSNNVGIGEKQAGRLLASLGDLSRFPTVGHLWAYCGYHVIDGQAPRRKRGERANWSSDAKMRAFLCAESCIKKRSSPFRPVYDAGREKYRDAVHPFPCVRCGPKGKPALPGSELSAGHQHARAMRLTAKAILRDMWVASR